MTKDRLLKAIFDVFVITLVVIMVHTFIDICTKPELTSYTYPTHDLLSPWSVVNAPESPCKKCGEHIFVAWILPPVNKQYLFDCNVVYLCAHCREKKLHTSTGVLSSVNGVKNLFNLNIPEMEPTK